MRPQDCLYTIAFLPRERIEALLLDEFAPLAREIQDHPDLDSLFFVRFSEPRWQLRFRVLGSPSWVRGNLREHLEARLADLVRQGGIEEYRFARYDRELDRYGGEVGMALAERLFFHDSIAALAFCDAERNGQTRRSRREFALLLTDRVLDLAGLNHDERIAFYHHGYQWALDNGEWSESDMEILERRFRDLLPGLDRLVAANGDDSARWGGDIAVGIANRFLTDARPILEAILHGIATGRILQEKIFLLWSYTHMFTNRIGIESSAEAISRYFMHRYLQQRDHVAG